jgi:hypothetical protein
MKKPHPSAPDDRSASDDAGSTESTGSAGSTESVGSTESTRPNVPNDRVDGDASPRDLPESRVEPEEMGGEAPCHLPRFWDVDE